MPRLGTTSASTRARRTLRPSASLSFRLAGTGYPLGRIYYGHSSRTTFHPTIVKFLEAQQVQKPFTVLTPSPRMP